MTRLACLIVLCLASVTARAQLTLNTSLQSFVPLTSTNWIADVWGYVDGFGNEYALVCRGNSGFDMWNVTNGFNPTLVAHINATASDLKDCAIWGNYAYLVQQGGPILIVDISIPAAANVVGTFSGPGHNAYCAEGHLFYSRSGSSGNPCEIWSLANPTNPVLQASFDPPGHNSHDNHVWQNRLYSHDISSGITRIVDVTNKANPIEMGATGLGNHSGWAYSSPGGAGTLLVTGDETAGGWLNSWDVTDHFNPIFLDAYFTDPAKSIHNMVVRGRWCYISYYVDGIRIVDLANPADLKEVGIYDVRVSNAGTGLFDGNWGVYPISETKVVLTEMFSGNGFSPGGDAGFYVIEFTPPTHVDMDISTTGVGDDSLSINGADPFGVVWNAVSVDTSQPFGTGGFLGLQGDALFSVLSASPPFTVQADGNGDVNFATGSGVPYGLSIDVRSITAKSGVFHLSQIARIEF